MLYYYYFVVVVAVAILGQGPRSYDMLSSNLRHRLKFGDDSLKLYKIKKWLSFALKNRCWEMKGLRAETFFVLQPKHVRRRDNLVGHHVSVLVCF